MDLDPFAEIGTYAPAPIDITYSLRAGQRGLLLALADVADQNETDTVGYSEKPSDGEYACYIYVLDHPAAGESVEVSSGGHPMRSLELLGFLYRLDNSNVFLCPVAFERAKYERKTAVGKWLARVRHQGYHFILGMTFGLSVVSTILSIIATIRASL